MCILCMHIKVAILACPANQQHLGVLNRESSYGNKIHAADEIKFTLSIFFDEIGVENNLETCFLLRGWPGRLKTPVS